MKTDLFIEMLSRGAHQEARTSPWQVLYLSIGSGIVLSMMLMSATLKVNADLLALFQNVSFLVKISYVTLFFVIAFISLNAVARPGAETETHIWRLVLPVVVISCIAVPSVWSASPELRESLIFSQTWSVCAVLIALLSSPVFAFALWAMKELAPTNLRLAGSVAGLFSGAAGALVYCIHCPEVAVPFVAIWYTLGMMIPMIFGYVLGPRLLRW
jgi:hypothetical protein